MWFFWEKGEKSKRRGHDQTVGYAGFPGGGATENHSKFPQAEAYIRTDFLPQGGEDYPLVGYSRNLSALPTQDCDET